MIVLQPTINYCVISNSMKNLHLILDMFVIKYIKVASLHLPHHLLHVFPLIID